MASASPATDFEFRVRRAGGGLVACDAEMTSAGQTVIRMDRSQERAVPAGAMLLDDFLAEFGAHEDIAPLLPSARANLASQLTRDDKPLTVRSLRLKLGLSQADLAARMHTTQANVSNIENREQKPGEDRIRELSAALEVDFNTLMSALANG